MGRLFFWLAVACETGAVGWYITQLVQVRERYLPEAHADKYRENIVPLVVLSLIVSGAILLRYYFHLPRMSLLVAYLPAIGLAVAMLGLTIGAMVMGGNWR